MSTQTPTSQTFDPKTVTMGEVEAWLARDHDPCWEEFCRHYLRSITGAMLAQGLSDQSAGTIASNSLLKLRAQARRGFRDREFKAADFLWKWCVRTARDEELKKHKTQQKLPTEPLEQLGEDGEETSEREIADASTQGRPEAMIERAANHDILQRCLEKLPHKILVTFQMVFIEGKTQQQAADILNLRGPATVSERFKRWIPELKQCLVANEYLA